MQVTVVVPTYNEAPNVAELVRRVAAATPSLDLEILFVDDSTDDTPRVIEQVAETAPIPVRMLHRGLGGRTLRRGRGGPSGRARRRLHRDGR